MSEFDRQFGWQAQYIDEVIRLIAPHIITVSRPEVDKKENGDLELAFPRNGTVSVRLRTQKYARYAGEITFRSRSRNGGYTELSKLIDGYGDYFFYGHVSDAGDMWFWHLLSLNAVRAAFTRSPRLLKRPEKQNPDGTRFLVFSPETDFPSAILATYQPAEAAE